jgi:hypothetical protein
VRAADRRRVAKSGRGLGIGLQEGLPHRGGDRGVLALARGPARYGDVLGAAWESAAGVSRGACRGCARHSRSGN